MKKTTEYHVKSAVATFAIAVIISIASQLETGVDVALTRDVFVGFLAVGLRAGFKALAQKLESLLV